MHFPRATSLGPTEASSASPPLRNQQPCRHHHQPRSHWTKTRALVEGVDYGEDGSSQSAVRNAAVAAPSVRLTFLVPHQQRVGNSWTTQRAHDPHYAERHCWLASPFRNLGKKTALAIPPLSAGVKGPHYHVVWLPQQLSHLRHRAPASLSLSWGLTRPAFGQCHTQGPRGWSRQS